MRHEGKEEKGDTKGRQEGKARHEGKTGREMRFMRKKERNGIKARGSENAEDTKKSEKLHALTSSKNKESVIQTIHETR